jgi:P-type Mg2+ transporter
MSNELAKQYASLKPEDVFLTLDVDKTGLSSLESKARLIQYGKNRLDAQKQRLAIVEWLLSFFKPLPLLLILLSVLSMWIGEARGAMVIALMVFLSTTFAFIQEYRSSKAAEKLKALVGVRVTVMRDFIETDISLDEVVPGDLVILSAGDIIPADLRLIETKDLFIDQSALTGESVPVEKHAMSNEGMSSIFDSANLCFMGCHVSSGCGKGLVYATASQTIFGEIAKDISAHTKNTKFDQGIEKFIWLMIKFMLFLVPSVFLANGLIKGNWLESLLFATAVAVGLTPEMLPLLVTINLAKGAISMAKKKVIVKKLNSIQNLGAMDILCTDKTGTLTHNEIVLEKYINCSNQEDTQVLELAYLNSYYQTGLKNLMDEAILKHKASHAPLISQANYQKIDEIPFDFVRRRMSVILRHGNGQLLLICKGAFEEMLQHCKTIQIASKKIPITETLRIKQSALVASLNQDGFRVVAIASKRIPPQDSFAPTDENDLSLIGYIAFLDPPKESAKPAILALREAGISIKILTGDNEIITRKVCHEVGISNERILLGSDLDKLDEHELSLAVNQCDIFAKLTPQQKSQIILTLRKHGHVVGFLGDGINDGPALKIADVGISVDTAVDIAKDTADIILLEKSLLVIKDGIIEGRKVFGNIMKYIKMSSSSNFGNMFSMLGASVLLPFLPMAPVQILLNNFLYDCSQTSIYSDHVDPAYIEKPKVWDIGSIARFMFFLGPISSIFDYATFFLMWFVIGANTIEATSTFQTGWFIESLISQTLIVHIIRTNKIPFVESKPSSFLLFTSIAICLIGILLPISPLGSALGMRPLGLVYWLGLLLILSSYFVLTYWVKSKLVVKGWIS